MLVAQVICTKRDLFSVFLSWNFPSIYFNAASLSQPPRKGEREGKEKEEERRRRKREKEKVNNNLKKNETKNTIKTNQCTQGNKSSSLVSSPFHQKDHFCSKIK